MESSLPGARGPSEWDLETARDLQQVTDVALAHLELEDLLGELLTRVTEILGTDTAAILLVEDDGTTLAARAAKGLEEEVERGFRLPVGAGFAGRVAATREPVVITDLSNSPIDVVNPLMREKNVRSLLGVPLLVEGRLIGVLHVGTLVPRNFTDDDVHLLGTVADRVAMAVERARLEPQQQIAARLQQSLLPTSLPEVPGVSLAARYLSAASGATVGGDWYDVIALPGGTVGITIGDVVGKGVEAAAFMGHLRSAVRAYALDGAEPAELVTKLNRFLDAPGEGRMATMIYAVLDPHGPSLTLCRAGHPYPFLVSPEGRTTTLDADGGPPLGVGPHVVYGEEEVELSRGTTLFFYTDGLIERRRRRLSETEAELAAIVAAAPLDPELLCAAVIESMSEEATEDDIAILAVQTVGLENPLALTVAARADELASIRRLLRAWLAESGATEDDLGAITLACSEACANAIEHAYGPGDATLEIEAERRDNFVQIVVRDTGRWRPQRGDARGSGLGLIRAFMDDVEISTTERGTTVTMGRSLRGAQA